MRVPVGVSNRHIHVSREDADVLFGKGYEFKTWKPLRQPGQFACEEVVTLIGPKGGLQNVRILGPVRGQTQVEISRTDGFVLGINPPMRDSGDLTDTPGVKVVGPCGEVELEAGVILPYRHLHLHPDDAEELGVSDKDIVAVKTTGERSVILENVLCRVSPNYRLEFHIDTDEANAAGLTTGDLIRVIAVDGFHELHTFRRQNVLVLNCGSSSVKYKLYVMPEERILSQGNIARRKGTLLHETMEKIFQEVGENVDLVAHRIAHGADLFPESVRIDEQVIERIASISHLAPLHNPINLEGVREAQRRYANLPYEYYEKHKIRKYGFHGSSHRYVLERAQQMLGTPKEKLRLISCHIGNGASITAIRYGESYDTSMGLTPLAGVPTLTRASSRIWKRRRGSTPAK